MGGAAHVLTSSMNRDAECITFSNPALGSAAAAGGGGGGGPGAAVRVHQNLSHHKQGLTATRLHFSFKLSRFCL